MCIWSTDWVLCYAKKKLCIVGLLRGAVDIPMYLCSRFGKGYGLKKKQLWRVALKWQLKMSQQCYALAENNFSFVESWHEIWCVRGRITSKISPELVSNFCILSFNFWEIISTGWNTSNKKNSLAKAWPVNKSWSIWRGLIWARENTWRNEIIMF